MRRALLAITAAVLVGACSGDEEAATPTPTIAEATTATSTAPASTPPATATAPAAAAAAAAAAAGVSLEIAEGGELGPFLTDGLGRALYVFLRDEPGVSNCNDTCLQNWPPFLADSADDVSAEAGVTGEVGVIELASGRAHVTYNGAPLYYWVADEAPGDATGHLAGGVWFVARPDTASTAVVNVRTEGDLAPYLVGPDGMTLYLFTRDELGVTNCFDGCAASWPPLVVPDGLAPSTVPAAAGELGVIERSDGLGRQVTYNGIPLYYWAEDAVPGDTTGQNVSDVWFVVPPDAGTTGAGTSPQTGRTPASTSGGSG